MKTNIFVNGDFLTERQFEQVPRIYEQIVVFVEGKHQVLKVNQVVWRAWDSENVAELDCSFIVSLRDPNSEEKIVDLSLDRFKR